MLPGNVAQTAVPLVDSLDIAAIQGKNGQRLESYDLGGGNFYKEATPNYSIYMDINGSGVINAQDRIAALNRSGSALDTTSIDEAFADFEFNGSFGGNPF